MRKEVYLFCALLAFCSCGRTEIPIAEEQSTIEYRIDDGSYAVVVVKAEGVSDTDARNFALTKAAELAKSYNYRYFTLEQEGPVMVARAQNASSNPPRNLYYEAITSDNFGQGENQGPPGQYPTVLPAYKVIIMCYRDNPPETAIDVCDMIKCP